VGLGPATVVGLERALAHSWAPGLAIRRALEIGAAKDETGTTRSGTARSGAAKRQTPKHPNPAEQPLTCPDGRTRRQTRGIESSATRPTYGTGARRAWSNGRQTGRQTAVNCQWATGAAGPEPSIMTPAPACRAQTRRTA
jgi:hypothetical protein